MKLNIYLSQDPAMFILRKTKIRSKNQKQPNANISTIDKYIVFYSYIEIILSNKKKKGLLIHPSTHINFKNIRLDERSRTQKSTFYMFLFLCILCVCAQSCPTLCDPMDCILPGSSVHRFSQARILKQVAISYFKGSSQSRD